MDLFSFLNTDSRIILIALYLINTLIFLTLLLYIPKNRKPASATSWLLLIAIAPIFGMFLFFLFGNSKLSKAKRNKQNEVTSLTRELTRELEKSGHVAKTPDEIKDYTSLITSLTGFLPTAGNDIKIISGYQEIIDEIIKAINKAQKYIYIEFYIMTLDSTTKPFFDALKTAKERGVEIFVMFDAWGSRKYSGYKPMQQRLTEDGINWRPHRPFSLKPSKYNRPDLRNHRKIIAIDNTDAFIGSLNMIEKTYERKDDISYIELMAQFKGPVVREAAVVFAGDWFLETNNSLRHHESSAPLVASKNLIMQILPSGPAYPYENNLKFFVSAISKARKSVVITNPYLVPDSSFLNVLTTAAMSGVEVSILNSEAIDQWMVAHAQRSYYEHLLKAGVKIFLYKKPQLVHEKFLTVDDEIAIIGSSNFDMRSFALDDECGVVAYDKTTAKTLRLHHEELKKESKQLSLTTWRKRPLYQVLLDSLARLTSSLQ